MCHKQIFVPHDTYMWFIWWAYIGNSCAIYEVTGLNHVTRSIVHILHFILLAYSTKKYSCNIVNIVPKTQPNKTYTSNYCLIYARNNHTCYMHIYIIYVMYLMAIYKECIHISVPHMKWHQPCDQECCTHTTLKMTIMTLNFDCIGWVGLQAKSAKRQQTMLKQQSYGTNGGENESDRDKPRLPSKQDGSPSGGKWIHNRQNCHCTKISLWRRQGCLLKIMSYGAEFSKPTRNKGSKSWAIWSKRWMYRCAEPTSSRKARYSVRVNSINSTSIPRLCQTEAL